MIAAAKENAKFPAQLIPCIIDETGLSPTRKTGFVQIFPTLAAGTDRHVKGLRPPVTILSCLTKVS